MILQENYRPIFHKTTDAKIFKNLLAHQIQHLIKKIITVTQVRLTPGIQGWLNIWKSINVIHYINRMRETHIRGILPWQNPKSFVIKTLSNIEKVENFLKMTKGIYEKPTANIIMVKNRKMSPINQEQDKDVHSSHFYST